MEMRIIGVVQARHMMILFTLLMQKFQIFNLEMNFILLILMYNRIFLGVLSKLPSLNLETQLDNHIFLSPYIHWIFSGSQLEELICHDNLQFIAFNNIQTFDVLLPLIKKSFESSERRLQHP